MLNLFVFISILISNPPSGTFSIVAVDTVTGEIGVAVASRFLGVGAVVPYAKADVGAVATQAWGNTRFGPRGLELLKEGYAPAQVLSILLNDDTLREQRQVGIVNAHGESAAFTGKSCLKWAGHITGAGYSIQGNILAGEQVVKAMEKAFLETEGELGDRLIAALEAGEKAGGDRRGKQSAALVVVREGGGYSGYNDRYIDIRVDDSPDPIKELKRIYKLWKRTFLIDAHGRIGDRFKREGKNKLAELEYSRAITIMDEALKEKPNDPDLLNNIAWFMGLRGIRLTEAKELIDRAMALRPNDANILDTGALIYYKLGNKGRAIELEEKAVKLDPENKYFRKMLMRYRGE